MFIAQLPEDLILLHGSQGSSRRITFFYITDNKASHYVGMPSCIRFLYGWIIK